ncbi:hypothetical protein [Streptomyces cinereoruber]|uniref:hypothetical protein n=1 Tax=Streptomyces cinereoruber TaxID=67260 RepID=UPI00362CFF60
MSARCSTVSSWRGPGVPLSVHQAALDLCAGLAAEGAAPAGRRMYRVYADRITTASTTA